MDMLENILSQEVVQKLGWTLLHSLWQGGVVVLLLAVCLRVLRKSSANLRYVISCLGLAVIVLLPVVTFYVVPAPAPISDVESVLSFSVPVTGQLQEVYDADMPLQRAAEYMQMFPSTSWKQRAKNFCTSALPYIVFGWFIGVLALSLWHLGGWAHLQRLKRKNINQVDASLKDKLDNLAERLKVTRPVKLMKSALVQIPTVVGCLRPVILLPASALTGLSSGQLEAVLAHELAHIYRYDYLVNMLQTVVEIVGFYHPAVWWISHKMRVERENCCDDLAVSVCGDKVGYARALTSMEEIRLAQGELVIAASGGNLFTRISRLVGNESAGKARPGWAPVVLSALLIIALAIPTTLALTAADSDSGLRADSITTLVSELVDEENINSSVAAQPASHLPGTDTQTQILFDCTIYEMPADLEIIEGKQEEKPLMGRIVWLGNGYAERLESLCRKNKKAKILSNPRILVLEGEEASMDMGNEIPYNAGYESTTEGGTGPKPIVKTAFDGIELKLKGHTVDSSTIRTEFRLKQSRPNLTTHKVDEGREVQIPVTESSECTACVTLRSGETIVIGGLKSQSRPNNQLLLAIIPSIVREEDTPQTIAPADIKDRDTYTVSLEIIGEQIRKLRHILKAQLASALAGRRDDKGAQVVSTLFKDDRGRESSLVFHLKKQNNSNLIDYFYIESPDKAGQELVPSRGKYRQPEAFPSALDETEPMPEEDIIESRIADKNPLSVVVKQINALREILNQQYVFNLIEITPHIPGKDVGRLSVILLQDGKADGQLLFHLLRDNGDWFVDCIEFVPADQIEQGLTLPTKKPTEQEPDSAQALENLRLAQAYMQIIQQDRAKSGQAVAIEQLYAALKGNHENLSSLAASCAERGDFEKAAEYQEMAIELAKSQKYYGIGIAINKTDGLIRIDAVLPNTPASGSSFQKGDIIEAVDGVSTEGMSLDDVVARIVGPKGTEVTLSVKSRSQDITMEEAFTRQLPLEGSHVLRAYEWRLAAYKSGKTWPQYRRMMEEQNVQKAGAPRIFELRYASAEELAEVLSRVLERRWKGIKDKPVNVVRIIPDPDTNRLIVLASPADNRLIEALITELDVIAKRNTVVLKAIPSTEAKQDAPVESTFSKIINLKYADCESVAQILQQLISDKQLKIVPDKHTNTLIVVATESTIHKILDLVAELDVPSREDTTANKTGPSSKLKPDTTAETADYQIIQLKLKYANCESVSEKVTKLFSAGHQFKIVPDKRTNTLLIVGTESAIQQIKALVAELDVPGSNKEL